MKLALALLLTLSATSALASDVTVSPDSRFVLVQKNLGVQRWAIVRDRDDLSITGNIFNPEGGSQFVWCSSLGDEMYDCVGNSGCSAEPCQWNTIATVRVPESFFEVSSEPRPTPIPTPFQTPRPTPRPTAKPTPPPSSGLQGLLGTWQFSYAIGPVPFTDTIRLQQLQVTQGVTFVVGVNQFNSPVVGGALDDVFSTTTVTTDWAVIALGPVICEAYAFDRNGDSAFGTYLLATATATDCGQFHGGYSLVGTRTSHSVSAPVTSDTLSLKRAERRSQRARLIEAREDGKATSSSAEDRTLEAKVGELARTLRAATKR